MRRLIGSLFIFLGLMTAVPSPARAIYSDEIAVSEDEVWKAALEAFKPYGFRKTNDKKKYLETRWIYDRVTRSGGLLKRVAKEEYERRYRMKVQIKNRAGDTVVEIRGVFQQRHMNLTPQLSWTLIKPRLEDLDLERDFFMKILSQMARNRSNL